ncbi:MAG: hypothetical protein IPG50_36100 [Myxococcales bacterium]|nr:hypothetical protein [Myxococcales bacterium]
MIGLSLVLTLGAACAFGGGGYLFGARLGRKARAELTTLNADKEQRIHALEEASRAHAAAGPEDLKAELQGLVARLGSRDREQADAIKGELRALATAVSAQERSQDALKADLHQQVASMAKMSPDPEALKKDFQRMVVPLIQQRENEARKIGDMMKEVLAPVLDRDRLGRELMDVKVSAGLHELPRVLDAVADKGGFSTVVLADDVGLPLASNNGARNVEALAGVSAMLFTLADRSAALGESRPTAVLVQDEHGQSALYRIFQVGSSRFVLTAVGRGGAIAPGALDPALPKLESALARPDAVA